jgi:hypothetical protein
MLQTSWNTALSGQIPATEMEKPSGVKPEGFFAVSAGLEPATSGLGNLRSIL